MHLVPRCKTWSSSHPGQGIMKTPGGQTGSAQGVTLTEKPVPPLHHWPSWAGTTPQALPHPPHPWIITFERNSLKETSPHPKHPQRTHPQSPAQSLSVLFTSPMCHSPHAFPCALLLRALTLGSSGDAPWAAGCNDRQKYVGVHDPGLPTARAQLIQEYKSQLPDLDERQKEGYFVLQRAPKGSG